VHNAHQSAIRLLAAGQLDAAEVEVQATLAELPDFWEARSNLAKVALARERWEEAIPLLERTLSESDQYECSTVRARSLGSAGSSRPPRRSAAPCR
jgi:thioredoxin-like negative regulator of GroEL